MIKKQIYGYADDIQVGTVFKRVDKNGNIWEAKVINRTDYFVDVEKTQPYQIKVADKEYGDIGIWHWEDAPVTYERCQINQIMKEVETGEYEDYKDLFGNDVHKPITKRVGTRDYYIMCKEDYSKYPKYDKRYDYQAPAHDYEESEKGIERFFNYCETGEFKLKGE